MYRAVAVSSILLVLAGCGGSSGTNPSFNTRKDQFVDFGQEFLATTRPVATFGDLPTSGSATFNGNIGVTLDDPGQTSVIGDLSLTTDFNGGPSPFGPVTGKADNFVSDTDESFLGFLVVKNTAFGDSGIATGVGFTGDLDGTLSGSETGSITVDADIAGTFATPIGGTGQIVGVVGAATGTVTTPIGTLAIDDSAFIVSQ